jgi:pyruvate/2-oxoglutarate dehydrogenase complex dihydrolipoamide dehydrogenase (E3) component
MERQEGAYDGASGCGMNSPPRLYSPRRASRPCGRDQEEEEKHMPQSEQLEVLVLGSGTGGKLIAWHMAQSGRRTAVVETHWVGGSCPNIACMPSKNEISSAKVAQLARDGRHYGTVTGSVTVDMAIVRQRKREMVERQIAKHLQIYKASGAELIMGSGRFVAPKILEVKLNDGGARVLAADKVFLNVGTHAAIPNVPGLVAAQPLTHVEALELDYLPQHLIVIGGAIPVWNWHRLFVALAAM